MKVIKVVCLIMSAIFMFYAPHIFSKKLTTGSLLGKSEEIEYQIIEIWNIDTFEGGSVSRTTFLEKRALEFEKKNTGKFFIVKSFTPTQAINKINDGEIPSMISYGNGFGKNVKNYVLPLYDNYNVRNDLITYGKINNVNYAIPYILGGYSVITAQSNGDDQFQNGKIIISSSEYINSINVLNENNLTGYEQLNLTSFDVYEGFIKQKYDAILGTQRDVFRCYNRNNNGNGNYQFKFLQGYSDLVQFISILNESNFEVCNEFLKYLVSADCQQKLCNINMFNVLKNEYYQDNFYSDFEKVLNRNIKSQNAFS